VPDRRLLDVCVHCGFCLPTCPTYHSWREEMDSPRGRIALMSLLGEGPPSPAIVRHIDRCLGCMGCVTACPSGVQYDALIEETRGEIERRHRRPLGQRLLRALIFALFPYPLRLRVALLLQLVFVKTGLRWLARRLGLLPAPLRALDDLAPAPSARGLFTRLPELTPARGERRARVALLAGCVQRVVFPAVNQATLRVLSAEGCEVVVPRDLGCCGALSLHAGRDDEARRLARAAIARLEREDVDAVVVNAAGCGSSMKEWGRLFAGDAAWAERAARVAARVKDVTELLTTLGPVAPRHAVPLRVAYHDACHLAHAQRVRAQPRALLAQIPGLELLEIPDGDQCCGSAGIYNLVEPASAKEIGGRKAANVRSVAPDVVAGGNPGCALQIELHLREQGSAVRAVHVVELVDASIRGSYAVPPDARRPTSV
jgi:glycolate oxidase iron-sulfur subunit